MKSDIPFLRPLNLSDKAALQCYEERMYRAYEMVESQRLLRRIWTFDDQTKRITTKVPYQDQAVFNFVEHNRFVGGLAFNIAEQQFQFSEYGFSFTSDIDEKTQLCEILTMFSDESKIDLNDWFKTLKMLSEHGFTDLVATSSPRLARLYQRFFKFEVIDSRIIEGEERHFIHIHLQTLLKRRQII